MTAWRDLSNDATFGVAIMIASYIFREIEQQYTTGRALYRWKSRVENPITVLPLDFRFLWQHALVTASDLAARGFWQ